MLVQDVMKEQFVTVPDTHKFFQAAEIFLHHHISAAPVVDVAGALVGVLSEKDLFRALYPTYDEFYLSPEEFVEDEWVDAAVAHAEQKTVREIMSKRLIVAKPDTHVMKIGGLMIATGIHQVPVVTEKNKIVGMVTRREIYHAILHQHYQLFASSERKNK
jgi:CBS domain-containing protein